MNKNSSLYKIKKFVKKIINTNEIDRLEIYDIDDLYIFLINYVGYKYIYKLRNLKIIDCYDKTFLLTTMINTNMTVNNIINIFVKNISFCKVNSCRI